MMSNIPSVFRFDGADVKRDNRKKTYLLQVLTGTFLTGINVSRVSRMTGRPRGHPEALLGIYICHCVSKHTNGCQCRFSMFAIITG